MNCYRTPIGCGREISYEELGSWDELTIREWGISGLCKECQDIVFAEEDEPPWVPEEELLWDDRL